VPAVPESPPNEKRRLDDRIPRGALAVVAIGILATIAAALLATDKLEGEAANVEWIQFKAVPDPKPVAVPGGKGPQMRLTRVGLRSTGTNTSGYSLFRSAATLEIDAGAPVGGARVGCSIHAPGGAEVAQTPDLRATYPRSSEELAEQQVPEVVLVNFSSHGTALATVDVEDLEQPFATEKNTKLEWPTFTEGTERWKWYLPSGPPKSTLKLPFYVVWRVSKPPAAEFSCKLKTSAGIAKTEASGAMKRVGEPINEEEGEEE
jgi:hypothetical protein